jgi:PAS domain S-box-containing protein
VAPVEVYVRELLFQALASAGDGAFIVDEDQRIIYWNQAAERILGHRSSEINGRSCYGMLNGQDVQGRVICRRHCNVTVTALGGGRVRNYDMSVRTRSDNSRWINVSTFVFPTNGQEAGPLVVHLFRNIPQRKQNEELLDKILTAVEKLRDQGQPHQLPQAPAVDSGAELTDREREVLSLLVRGSSTEDMAQALSISTSTVRNHIRNIMHKFEVHSRLEAVLHALRHGLVTLD